MIEHNILSPGQGGPGMHTAPPQQSTQSTQLQQVQGAMQNLSFQPQQHAMMG